MSKIVYCIYCGTENISGSKKCIKCKKKLDSKEHLWRDYLYSHIKDDLKGNVTDKFFSLITNYVKSHLYGVILTITIVSTVITGVVTKVDDTIVEVTEKPLVEIKREELMLDDPIVEEIYKTNKFFSGSYYDVNFYEDRLITYDDIKEEDRFEIAFYVKKHDSEPIIYNSCEETKDFKSLYSTCTFDSSFVIGEDAFSYSKINKDELEKNYREIFGPNKSFAKKEYHLHASMVEYSESIDEYLYYTLPEGYYTGVDEVTKLVKAVKVGNTIELYDYYVFMTSWIEHAGTFKDRHYNTKLSDDFDYDIIEAGQLYKHIYRKDQNGNYYWYSSEPIDKI